MVGWVLPSKKPRDHRAWVVLVSAACIRRLKIDPAAFLHDPHPSLCRRLPRTSLSIERLACCLAVHDLLRNLTNNGSRVPPATAGIMFLSGGLSELDSTLYLNAMNQQPNPWHVSFSYARALQNSVIKTWAGDDAKKAEAQAILARRAKENGMAQL